MLLRVCTEHLVRILGKGSDALDKQLVGNIKKICKGIAIYDLIVLVVLFVIRKASFSTVGGLLAGSIVSIIALILLAKNIETLVGKDKVKASLSATFGYIIRMILYAAILLFAAINKSINLYTVALGLISTSLTIRAQAFVQKKIGRKEI